LAERIAAADALGQAGDARIDLRREDYWVTIPAGKFLMGAQSENPEGANYDPESTYTDEWRETPHEVYLGRLCIARYPVTVGQYRQFVEDEGYQDERWWTAGGFGEYSEPDEWERQVAYPSRPVVGVSWWEAMAFCAWAGFRLATEAEWERAARGTEGRKYPWGPNPSTSNGRTTMAAPGIRRRWASIRWAARRRGFATWRAMCGSGARMALPSILPKRRQTRAGTWEARTGCSGAAVGRAAPGLPGGVPHQEHPSYRGGDLGFRLARTVPSPSR
jgi:formylglycine-generating enzyme required for sulfatase activity